MRDEEYGDQDLPAYGERAQPALVARTGPELRKVGIGTGLAALALLLALVAVWRYPTFVGGGEAGRGWAIMLAACCLGLLLFCLVQLVAWRRALAAWAGRTAVPLRSLSRASWAVHLVSYVALAGVLAGCVGAVVFAGWTAVASVLSGLALIAALPAQVLAAAQYVRVSGPPGTVPARMHRLTERDDRRR